MCIIPCCLHLLWISLSLFTLLLSRFVSSLIPHRVIQHGGPPPAVAKPECHRYNQAWEQPLPMLVVILLLSNENSKKAKAWYIPESIKKKKTAWSRSCFCSRTCTNACLLSGALRELRLSVQRSVWAAHLVPVVLCQPSHPEPHAYRKGKFCHQWTKTSGRRVARVWTGLSLYQQRQETLGDKKKKKPSLTSILLSKCGGKCFLPFGCQPLSKLIPPRIVFLCLASVYSKLIHDLLLLKN